MGPVMSKVTHMLTPPSIVCCGGSVRHNIKIFFRLTRCCIAIYNHIGTPVPRTANKQGTQEIKTQKKTSHAKKLLSFT